LLTSYRSELQGVVVYDPSVPDSINVATTLAGLDRAIVVSPTMAQQLAVAPYLLPVVDDLRGRFTTRLDAYQWEFDNVWAKDLVTNRMLIGLPPLRSGSVHLTD